MEEGRTTIKRTELVTEVRLVETNPAFKHVQECLDWIEEQQVLSMDFMEFMFIDFY